MLQTNVCCRKQHIVYFSLLNSIRHQYGSRSFHTVKPFLSDQFKRSAYASLLKKIKPTSIERSNSLNKPTAPVSKQESLFSFQQPAPTNFTFDSKSTSNFKEIPTGTEPNPSTPKTTPRGSLFGERRDKYPPKPIQSSKTPGLAVSNSENLRKDKYPGIKQSFPPKKYIAGQPQSFNQATFSQRELKNDALNGRISSKPSLDVIEQKKTSINSDSYTKSMPSDQTTNSKSNNTALPLQGDLPGNPTQDKTNEKRSHILDKDNRPHSDKFSQGSINNPIKGPLDSGDGIPKTNNVPFSSRNKPDPSLLKPNPNKWTMSGTKLTPMSQKIKLQFGVRASANATEKIPEKDETESDVFVFSMAKPIKETLPENPSLPSIETLSPLEKPLAPTPFNHKTKVKTEASPTHVKPKERVFVREEKKKRAQVSVEPEFEPEPKKEKPRPKVKKVEVKSVDVYIPPLIKVANLARLLGVTYNRLRSSMRRAGLPDHPYDYLLNAEDAGLVAMSFNLNPIVDAHQAKDLYPQEFTPEEIQNQLPRSPVVTVMGHVDHGKTTLLDTLRKTSVAAGEAGGITQHIGAFQVQLGGANITFLDTPGHAAFSAMRARGAKTTDIVVLVVAADDGIMPQTLEAIQHAADANVPLIVALTKCDKPTRNIKKIKDDLLMHGVQLEDFGGDTQVVEISAPTGMGLDTLKETILTLAEVLDLKAPTSGPTEAVVLESHVAKGLGTVASVVVHRGTLLPNQILVAGQAWCRVKNILDENGRPLKKVLPGFPAQISGWRDFPGAGDYAIQASTEDEAKVVINNRNRKKTLMESMKEAEAINEKRQKEHELALAIAENPDAAYSIPEDIPSLSLVIKADVSGTAEAIEESIKLIPSSKVNPRVVSRGVGSVTKADVDVALASEGVIMAFNVKNDKEVVNLARSKKVTIANHTVIYKLLESVREYMINLLPQEYKFVEEAKVEVVKVFEMKLKGRTGLTRIAGCKVLSGTLLKTHLISLSRGGSSSSTLHTGHLSITVLKYFKEDVTSVKQGLECAIELDQFTGFQEGDILLGLIKTEVPKSL